MAADLKDTLTELQLAVATGLLARLRSGEATAADFNVARQLCKDHNLELPPTPKSPLGALAKSVADGLPFPAAPGSEAVN